MYTYLSLAVVLAMGVRAKDIDIDVGAPNGSGGIVFVPDKVTAAVGDSLRFHFYPQVHGVAQSTFDKPCVPDTSSDIWSGFMSVPKGEGSKMFVVSVTSTDPMWIYCPEIGHCSNGMAMVVNEPSSGETLEMYMKAAMGTSEKAPSKVGGGMIVPNVDSDDDSSSSMSSSMMSSSMSSSMMMTSSMSSSMSSATMMSSSSMSMAPSMTSSAPAMTSTPAVVTESSNPAAPPPNAAPAVGASSGLALILGGFATGIALFFS